MQPNFQTTPQDLAESPLRFEGGSFEPIKFFSNFFTRSFSGSEPEINRFNQRTQRLRNDLV